MFKKKLLKYAGLACASLIFTACNVPYLVRKSENRAVPANFMAGLDTTNTAKVNWKQFFTDPYLNTLIDSALKNNQGLNIVLHDINIARNEVRGRKGQYLPFVGVGPSVGVDKVARYTRLGAVEANNELQPGKKFPQALPDYNLSVNVSWEVDIWKKLRNSRKAAVYSYLASTEGRNFTVTMLIAQIANSYYELMALDNQLEILKKNILIQQNALEIVKQLKSAAKVTELAVRRFEAEVSKNQSRIFYIAQQITENENRINYLAGRFPQPVQRNSKTFLDIVPDTIHAGIPSQMLQNRPDIRQSEQQLAAAKLDVKVAKTFFYPSLMINAGFGYEAFTTQLLTKTPESMLYLLAGQLVSPLVNRNGIKAMYFSANSRQTQAIYNYEKTVLNGYIEVANQLANIINLRNSYEFKTRQVDALTRSIDISTGLFQSARADYMEVLLVQRDALESKFELTEIKKEQMNARVNIYQALGGGWQ